ncbi:MAG: hypothetical protein VYA35_07015 [Pseudomonadota bacterium]|nr:hypothetical protein [Pseudomonadota bacterium]
MELIRNHQWVATDEGIDRADGKSSYWIAISRIFEDGDHRGQGKMYDWPVHMAEKTWVDIDAFIEAFDASLKFQAERSGVEIDETALDRSYAEAYRIARR